MFRIEVYFLILILVSVIVCQNATDTASSPAPGGNSTSSPATSTTTKKPDLIQDTLGMILKFPEEVVGAITDFFGMFKPT